MKKQNYHESFNNHPPPKSYCRYGSQRKGINFNKPTIGRASLAELFKIK